MLALCQIWAPIGARWTYTQGITNPSYTTYSTFQCVADTVIGGHSCRLIKETERTGPSSYNSYTYFMFADSENVYNWRNASWCLLYRWGVVGDSFEVNCTGLMAHILAIDTIQVNGILRRAFLYGAGSMAIDFSGVVIEGIGHTISMFPAYDNGGFASPLRCYEDTMIGLYKSTYNGQSGTQDCEEVIDRTGIDPTAEDKGVAVGPTLVANGWTQVSVTHPTEVTLYSVNGQKLLVQTILSSGQIDMRPYADGQYFLSLVRKDKVIHTRKLVKMTQ